MRRLPLFIAAILIISSCVASDPQLNKSGITVISREDGSGTRKAFSELFDLHQKNSDGTVRDLITENSAVTNSAAVMMASVAGDPNAIGYLSLGTPCSLVKMISIDGVLPSVENIKNGSYRFCRPFIAATVSTQNEAAKDFLSFITSEKGCRIAEQNGFVGVNTFDYAGIFSEGEIIVSGSSSVMPLMQKYKEGYQKINTKVKIAIQQSDSSSGIAAVLDGVCDIGLMSRYPTESELKKGIIPTTIAIDGIAVILNRSNSIDDLTSEQIRKIYSGETTCWQEIKAENQ